MTADKALAEEEVIEVIEEEIEKCPACRGKGQLFALRRYYDCGVCNGKGHGTKSQFAANRKRLEKAWSNTKLS